MVKLSILIATVVNRKAEFIKLHDEFGKQILALGLEGKVEIVFKSDNKEMTIGDKRNWLLDNCKGEWIVFFDDDDWPYPYYVEKMWNAINQIDIDCVGMNISMTTNGIKPQTCCHRLKYKYWMNSFDGWDYVRNITHFNPVLREKALAIRFKSLRFAEDKDYSDRITPTLKKEHYIEEPMFHYRYTTTDFKERYGIK